MKKRAVAPHFLGDPIDIHNPPPEVLEQQEDSGATFDVTVRDP